jgi:Ser/Thr protein kinase RdoA (MazF antagonist)
VEDADQRTVKQIYKSAWTIDDCYVLKRSTSTEELDKSIALSQMLLNRNIPVAKYNETLDGAPYWTGEGEYFCLMDKMPGEHIDPCMGDVQKTGELLGEITAKLHHALKEIEGKVPCYDSDYLEELNGWIIGEFKEKNIKVRQKILEACQTFAPHYAALPRQLIHRDMHLGNLLFKDGKFVGYLDFDISQRNVRIFDICYLGTSMLVGNYEQEDRFKIWQDIFDGVLKGYERISPLSREEMRAIPLVCVSIELIFSAFFLKVNLPDLAHSCITMTNWLYDNQDRLLKQGVS